MKVSTLKKVTLFSSAGLAIAWVFTNVVYQYATGGACRMTYIGWCGVISKWQESFLTWTLPIFSLLIILTAMYFVRDAIVNTWFKYFASWWIVATAIAVVVTPQTGGGLISVNDKAAVALFASLMFVIVSLTFIIWKQFSKR